MPETRRDIFVREWEERIIRIESQTLDSTSALIIKNEFEKALFKLRQTLQPKEAEDAYELETLASRLKIALATAQSNLSKNHNNGPTATQPNTKRVFISHSSKDAELIDLTELAFGNSEVQPYFAKRQMEGKSPIDKITQAIQGSMALFAYITPNTVNDSHTRDWINFEFGVAKAIGIPIYCLLDAEVAKQKTYPELMKEITDYEHFNSSSNEECRQVAKFVRDKSLSLAQNPQKSPARQGHRTNEEDWVSMQEAQQIAITYVSESKPEYDKVTVTAIEPQNGTWVVKGTLSKRNAINMAVCYWMVTVTGKEVTKCNFRTGAGFAIGTGK